MSNDDVKELSTRIIILETLTIQKEKVIDRLLENVEELNKKLEELKYEIKMKKIDEDIKKQVEEIEEHVDEIRLELPEIRLIKQVVLALIAIVLTSFVGLIGSSLSTFYQKQDVNEVLTNISNEYKKNGDHK